MLSLYAYRYGQSFYHRHPSLLKLAELMILGVISQFTSWYESIILLVIFFCWLSFSTLNKKEARQLCTLQASIFVLFMFVASVNFSGISFSFHKLELVLSLNLLSIEALLFLRHTQSLRLLCQLYYLFPYRGVRYIILLVLLVLLFFPELFASVHRRLLMFRLRGGRYWPYWRSLTLLFLPFFGEMEEKIHRVTTALVLRNADQGLLFYQFEHLPLKNVLCSIFFLIVLVFLVKFF